MNSPNQLSVPSQRSVASSPAQREEDNVFVYQFKLQLQVLSGRGKDKKDRKNKTQKSEFEHTRLVNEKGLYFKMSRYLVIDEDRGNNYFVYLAKVNKNSYANLNYDGVTDSFLLLIVDSVMRSKGLSLHRNLEFGDQRDLIYFSSSDQIIVGVNFIVLDLAERKCREVFVKYKVIYFEKSRVYLKNDFYFIPENNYMKIEQRYTNLQLSPDSDEPEPKFINYFYEVFEYSE